MGQMENIDYWLGWSEVYDSSCGPVIIPRFNSWFHQQRP